LNFVVQPETDIEGTHESNNQNSERNDLRAGIDLANQFPREFAQKDFRVVTTRRRRSFHRRLLNERRHMTTIPPSRHQPSAGGNWEKMNRGTRWPNPNFIAVIDAAIRLDRPAV